MKINCKMEFVNLRPYCSTEYTLFSSCDDCSVYTLRIDSIEYSEHWTSISLTETKNGYKENNSTNVLMRLDLVENSLFSIFLCMHVQKRRSFSNKIHSFKLYQIFLCSSNNNNNNAESSRKKGRKTKKYSFISIPSLHLLHPWNIESERTDRKSEQIPSATSGLCYLVAYFCCR